MEKWKRKDQKKNEREGNGREGVGSLLMGQSL